MKTSSIVHFSKILLAMCLCIDTSIAAGENGLVRIPSNHSPGETIDRLESVLASKGMTIFKRVRHSDAAKNVGIALRPTELLIFGNPKVGTPLMLCSQTMAIDLPQKALAYEDEDHQVWLVYNDPEYMAHRHNMKGCAAAIKKVTNALATFSRLATE